VRARGRLRFLICVIAAAGCASFGSAKDETDASAPPADGGTVDGGVSSDGGNLRPLGMPVSLAAGAHPDSIGVAVNNEAIFISTGTAIYSRAKDDLPGYGNIFIQNLDTSRYLAVSQSQVFWTEYGGKSVSRVQLNGSQQTKLNGAQLDGPTGITALGGKVWVTEYNIGQILMFDENASGAQPSIAPVDLTGKHPEGIAGTGTTLYVALNTGGAIVSIDANAPTKAPIVANVPAPAGLAFDETQRALYITSQADPYGIYRWREGTKTADRVAKCESSPLGIAVDDAYVYWIMTNASGATLWRASK
jgi:hypothetical protein